MVSAHRLLSITADNRTAEELAEKAAVLLRSHGGNVATFGIGSGADPAEIILSHAKTFEPDMLVMGAYGRRGLRDMLFGSCTRRLMAECGTALFLQH
jgi:nucleotide-binding universal stress UspA family protein